MGVLEGSFKHGSVVPFGGFNAPGMGAPVVQSDLHVDSGRGHFELTGKVEHLPMLLDQFGFVLVLVGQHHITLEVAYLIFGSHQFIHIDYIGLAFFTAADIYDICARVVGSRGFPVKDDVLQCQLRGNVAFLQVIKQKLILRAFGGEHVVGFHRNIPDGEARLAIRILRGQSPHLLQFLVLHHTHGHAAGPAVQRPSIAPERPALLNGDYENLDFENQFDFSVYADLQVYGARIITSSRRQCIGIQEHTRQLDIGIDRTCDGYRYILKELDGEGNGDAHAHAHLSDQIDFGGHFTGKLLLIGSAFEFLKVVVKTDLLAVFSRDCNAEGGNDSCLTNQIDVDAKGDDAIEGVLVL